MRNSPAGKPGSTSVPRRRCRYATPRRDHRVPFWCVRDSRIRLQRTPASTRQTNHADFVDRCGGSEIAHGRPGRPSCVATALAAFVPDVETPPFPRAVGRRHGPVARRTRARTSHLPGPPSNVLRVCGIHRPSLAADAPRPARSHTRDGLGAHIEDRSYQPNWGYYRSAARKMPAGFSSYRPARSGGPLKALRIRPLRRWIAGYFSFSTARISLETANAVP